MPTQTEADVLAALRRNQVASVYLLVGDDEVGKTRLIEALSALVEPDLQGFNLQRIYANERSLDDIVAAARTLPFLGTHRVVIALRCEIFLKGKGRATAADDDDDAGREDGEGEGEGASPVAAGEIERFLAAEGAGNVLVLVAADMNRTTRLAKQLLKTATVVEFWGLKSGRDAKGRDLAEALGAGERFVLASVRDAGLRIQRAAVEPLLEHAGTDITALRNDVERLVSYCLGRDEITLDDVKAVVGGAVQLDEWALTRAVQAGDAREALRQLQLAIDSGQSPWMLLGQLGWFVRTRLGEQSPAHVTAAVDALFRADTALKSSGGDPQVLLERLIVELCGVGQGSARDARSERRR